MLGPKFNDHYSQATLFYNSLSDIEKEHLIVRSFPKLSVTIG